MDMGKQRPDEGLSESLSAWNMSYGSDNPSLKNKGDKEMNNRPIQDVYFDVLRICYFSGYRGRGVEKLIEENRELQRCMRNADAVLINFPWTEWYSCDFEIFFYKFITACQNDHTAQWHRSKSNSDFPASATVIPVAVAEKCLAQIIECCGVGGNALLKIQNKNRHLRSFIEANSDIKAQLSFVTSWLDENESFFEELRQTLKHIFQNPQYECKLRPWIGRYYFDLWITRRKPAQDHQQDPLAKQVERIGYDELETTPYQNGYNRSTL